MLLVAGRDEEDELAAPLLLPECRCRVEGGETGEGGASATLGLLEEDVAVAEDEPDSLCVFQHGTSSAGRLRR